MRLCIGRCEHVPVNTPRALEAVAGPCRSDPWRGLAARTLGEGWGSEQQPFGRRGLGRGLSSAVSSVA